MAGGKQTPRQRMIGILYLVLLGLIALSIPDSFMDALRNVTHSLDTSSGNVTKGIQSTYSTFEATKLKEQHERAQPIYDTAKQASKAAEDLYNYVQALREELVQTGGGINSSINDVSARDNLDISPHVMIDGKKGEELREKNQRDPQKIIRLFKTKRPCWHRVFTECGRAQTNSRPFKNMGRGLFWRWYPTGRCINNAGQDTNRYQKCRKRGGKKNIGGSRAGHGKPR